MLSSVVALSDTHFTVKQSVRLPSSCNSVPLIATATTKLKEVAFSQLVTQYDILYCYPLSRPSLLNEHWLRRTVRSVEYWNYMPILFASVTEQKNMLYLRLYKVKLV